MIPKASYNVGYGTVTEGDTALYAGELPCKVLIVFQDGDVEIELSDKTTICTKWRNVSPWEE